MIKIKDNNFRTDFDQLFEMTDTLSCNRLTQTPFIVLDEKEGICLCDNALELVQLFPSTTKVLKQWVGRWKSDFLVFTVGDVKKALLKKENL